MKKLFLLLALACMMCGQSLARKSYVTIYASLNRPNYFNILHARISGDVPEGIPTYFGNTVTEGEIINKLAEKGFVVEQIAALGTSYNEATYNVVILMSKPDNTDPDDSAIEAIRHDDNTPAKEVARYNLQGLPVTENEKGVQIIVYSNYTTKTVLVE